MNVLVTGANGFIGKHLTLALKRLDHVTVSTYDIIDKEEALHERVKNADFIYHLAGVNRSEDPNDFHKGNVSLIEKIIDILSQEKNCTPILFTSTIQVESDNVYGKTKKEAEDLLLRYNEESNARIFIYRLKNVYGKWCKPNYNSVIATFCFNISHNIPITISDETREVEFVYIDDVISNFLKHVNSNVSLTNKHYEIDNTHKITLGKLAQLLFSIRDIPSSKILPDMSNDFIRNLVATYLSYKDPNDHITRLDLKIDNRGSLFELIKSPHAGQIFVSYTKPGITRGNHYHDTKIEKFCVIQGNASVKLRHILESDCIEYNVDGSAPVIIDIPPGYTHSIENTGSIEMLTLFWASEIFNPESPDTFPAEVEK